MKRKKSLLRIFLPLALIAVLALGRIFVFHTLRIEGTSMNNTLKSGDIVLLLSLFGQEPSRGDVVECRFPNRDGTYVKRVVGLPNEQIEISNGDLSINGQRLHEAYVSSECEDYSILLGDDEYLLLGDNRAESYDSRAEDIGPAKLDNLIGKVVFSLWPFRAIQ